MHGVALDSTADSQTKATAPSEAPKQEAPLDGPALRRLIVSGMSKATQPATPIVPHSRCSSTRISQCID
jgi:hypothetical protein